MSAFLPPGMFFGLTWNLGPPSSRFAMTTLVFGRLNPPSFGDVAEHEIEHARHQQWDAKHEDDREHTAEGTGQVFQGDVECFHVDILNRAGRARSDAGIQLPDSARGYPPR